MRLEAADAESARISVATIRRIDPSAGADILEINEGVLAFGGLRCLWNRSMGLGVAGPMTAEELDRAEAFYAGRNPSVVIELSPFADPALIAALEARGYQRLGTKHVLVAPVEVLEGSVGFRARGAVTVARIEPEGEAEWVATVGRGFTEEGEVPFELTQALRESFHRPKVTAFLARCEGTPAGGGAVARVAGVAMLFGTSTLPEWRRRGVHTALVRARLEEAANAGCDLATVTVLPESTAEQSFAVQGFRLAYARTRFVRELSTS